MAKKVSTSLDEDKADVLKDYRKGKCIDEVAAARGLPRQLVKKWFDEAAEAALGGITIAARELATTFSGHLPPGIDFEKTIMNKIDVLVLALVDELASANLRDDDYRLATITTSTNIIDKVQKILVQRKILRQEISGVGIGGALDVSPETYKIFSTKLKD